MSSCVIIKGTNKELGLFSVAKTVCSTCVYVRACVRVCECGCASVGVGVGADAGVGGWVWCGCGCAT